MDKNIIENKATSVLDTAYSSLESSNYYVNSSKTSDFLGSATITTSPDVGSISISSGSGSYVYSNNPYGSWTTTSTSLNTDEKSEVDLSKPETVIINMGGDKYSLKELIEQHNALIIEVRRLREEIRKVNNSLKK